MSGPRAFTLIELLIAMSLVTLIGIGASTTLLQLHSLTRRVQALQLLHSQARIIYERFSAEVAGLQQTGACFVTCTAGTSGGLEVVFLGSKYDALDFTIAGAAGRYIRGTGDLVWTRWYWNGVRQELQVARSAGAREFTADVSWGPGPGMDFGTSTAKIPSNVAAPSPFRNLPSPQRVVAADRTPATTLDRNAYGTGSSGDLGDYAELVQRSIPIASGVTAFRCDVVAQKPSESFIGDPEAGSGAFWADGIRVDSQVQAGNTDFDRRPRILRVRFTLTEPRSGVAETFTFSFPAPALGL